MANISEQRYPQGTQPTRSFSMPNSAWPRRGFERERSCLNRGDHSRSLSDGILWHGMHKAPQSGSGPGVGRVRHRPSQKNEI
jgi:hypothetical protein